MGSMFYGAVSFNQPIGDWDVSKVTYMKFMFKNAVSFNQPIGDWTFHQDNISTYMFDGASSIQFKNMKSK